MLAGAVKQLRRQNPDTVFAAAGDLIGASTFESFIQKDKPTIDALNEAGLEVSAAGNHEFDQGYDDLVDRVMAPYDADDQPVRWRELAVHRRQRRARTTDDGRADRRDLDQGLRRRQGRVRRCGHRAPARAGLAGRHRELDVTDIVDAVNAAADDLKADGADVIVLLVHEGAPSTDCADDGRRPDVRLRRRSSPGSTPNVDAIVVRSHPPGLQLLRSPVPAGPGRAVTKRPVVSAGQYGTALNKLVFTVDTATGEVQARDPGAAAARRSATTGRRSTTRPTRPTTAIVDAAVGRRRGRWVRSRWARSVARSTAASWPTARRRTAAGVDAGQPGRRGPEVGHQRPGAGAAQIAFMNPGGLRARHGRHGAAAFPRTLTYQQAADVQPFANTLVNMDLTGAQIKTVLEQQWQRRPARARPFLKLGISKGFTYTYDAAAGGLACRALGARSPGCGSTATPIDPATTYSVTVNSFLAAGGDNFLELANGTDKQDTGKTDLQAMVDYMAAVRHRRRPGRPVDYSQNGVNVGRSRPARRRRTRRATT